MRERVVEALRGAQSEHDDRREPRPRARRAHATAGARGARARSRAWLATDRAAVAAAHHHDRRAWRPRSRARRRSPPSSARCRASSTTPICCTPKRPRDALAAAPAGDPHWQTFLEVAGQRRDDRDAADRADARRRATDGRPMCTPTTPQRCASTSSARCEWEISVAIRARPRAYSGRARCDAAVACRQRLRALRHRSVARRRSSLPSNARRCGHAAGRRGSCGVAGTRGLAVDQEWHVYQGGPVEPRLPGNGLRTWRVRTRTPQGGVRRVACRGRCRCGLATSWHRLRSLPPVAYGDDAWAFVVATMRILPGGCAGTRRRIRCARPIGFHRGDAAGSQRARHVRRPERSAARDRLPAVPPARRRVPGHVARATRADRAADAKAGSTATAARCSPSAIRCSRSIASARPRFGCSSSRRCRVRSPAFRSDVVELTRNFRSQRSIVGWVNHVFAHVLPRASDAGRGEAGFRASYADPSTGNDVTPTLDRRANARRRSGHGRREDQ